MSITHERKTELIHEYQRGDGDTGSAQVQIAVLTERIQNLTAHMQLHRQDHGSRRGLLGLVSRRRRLLNYLKRTNPDGYREMIDRLGLRK